MKLLAREPAYLLLEDGTLLEGTAIGKKGTSGGEICFNTGMTGYQEIYTDPSYTGQIIVNTTSHIGNYGTLGLEQESERPTIRSEEHTSELQSPVPISYAVFCLKKKIIYIYIYLSI